MTAETPPAATRRGLRDLLVLFAQKEPTARRILGLDRTTCDREGHLRPTVAWYCAGPHCCSHACRRCGVEVEPVIDYSGHP